MGAGWIILPEARQSEYTADEAILFDPVSTTGTSSVGNLGGDFSERSVKSAKANAVVQAPLVLAYSPLGPCTASMASQFRGRHTEQVLLQ